MDDRSNTYKMIVPTSLYICLPCFSSEAVTGVVGRADVGACLFFIGSLLAYIKSHQMSPPLMFNFGLWNLFLLLLCFVLCVASMLTKEQGITVLGLCVVYEVLAIANKTSLRKQSTQDLSMTQVGAPCEISILTAPLTDGKTKVCNPIKLLIY